MSEKVQRTISFRTGDSLRPLSNYQRRLLKQAGIISATEESLRQYIVEVPEVRSRVSAQCVDIGDLVVGANRQHRYGTTDADG